MWSCVCLPSKYHKLGSVAFLPSSSVLKIANPSSASPLTVNWAGHLFFPNGDFLTSFDIFIQFSCCSYVPVQRH